MKATISDLTKNLEEGKVRSAELEWMAKEKKRDFYHSLALNIQKRLPLENQLLTNLAYIDSALINNEKNETAFRKIADKMPYFIKPEEKDDVIAELRTKSVLVWHIDTCWHNVSAMENLCENFPRAELWFTFKISSKTQQNDGDRVENLS